MGRITSVDRTLSCVIMPTGALLSAVLGDFLGTRLLFLILGLIGTISAFLVWQFSRINKYDYYDEQYINQIAEKIRNKNKI